MDILYEDNHVIAVNKLSGQPIQGDSSGDESLLEMVRGYIKERDGKPGNVFLGLVHRLDRPVSGVVLFAKTSKCLSRLNGMFRDKSAVLSEGGVVSSEGIDKRYWAWVEGVPRQAEGQLTDYLWKNEKQNKTYVTTDVSKGKYASLVYKVLLCGERYTLLEVELLTGRHHQIRCQLAHMGCPVKGDLKYGAKRSNPDGGISLHAREICFEHPVSHRFIRIIAPCPDDKLWNVARSIENDNRSL